MKLFNALVPKVTLPKVRLLLLVERPAMPVPLSATCCGLVVALSVSVRVALCAPTLFGENATPSVQLVLGATVMGTGPHVPVPLSAYSGFEGVALEMISELAAPVLETVRILVIDWPTATFPKAIELATRTVVVGVAVAVGVEVAVEVAVFVAVEVAVAV